MLHYFFFLAWNWSFRLAFFVTRHEIRGEKKYGVSTVGVDDLTADIPKEKLAHASIYQPVNYYTAEELFEQLVLEDVEGALLDLGCGKGRIFGVGAAYGFKQIIGVDFSEKLCADARQTAEKLMNKNNNVTIEVVCEDAAVYAIPATVTTIFLFNPFDIMIMRQVIKNINESQRMYPRPIKILYANPVCKKAFADERFIETFHFQKMIYLEGSVLEREA